MLWYHIALVLYGILTDCWLNLNGIHTCAPIEKLKEAKDVPHACARRRRRAEPRHGVAWRASERCVAWRDVAWRDVHEHGWGLVLPLGLAKKEEEIQTQLKMSCLLRVSYHPVWWWLLESLWLIHLPHLSGIIFPPVSLLSHTIHHTVLLSSYIRTLPIPSSARTECGRAGLRNRQSHRDTCSGVCGRSGFYRASSSSCPS
jgi:hypothetical protein